MASKNTYECFVCKSNGFPNVQVYLAGKDESGKAIRLEEDGVTPHTHKTKVPSQQTQQQQQLASQKPIWDIVNTKLDRIIAILEERLSPKDD